MAAVYASGPSFYPFDSCNSEIDIEYEVDDISSENKNTKRKTETDMRIFSAYLISLKEMRKAEDIPPQELDPYLSMFFSVVKKHDGHEYEPASLRGMLCSIERYLRMKGYQNSITRDAAFNNTRNTLKNKQRILRENGKGMKKLVPDISSDPLGPSTVEKLNQLYAAKELGPYNPMSVINSLCFSFVVYFKMRKAIDHKQLLWGDIVLRSSATAEFLCYEPLEGKEYLRNKLKGIEDCRVWSNSMSGPNKDPILIYKLYSQKRPAQMMSPDSPFYLGVSTSHPVQNQPWYKNLPMGVNKLNDLVRMIRDITGIQKVQPSSAPTSPQATKNTVSSPLSRTENEDDLNTDTEGEDASHLYEPVKLGRCSTHVVESNDAKADFQNGFSGRVSEECPSLRNRVCNDSMEKTEMAVDLSCADKTEASSNQTDGPRHGVSLDVVKATIRDLFEKLDKNSRWNLVGWMNRVELDADGECLRDNLEFSKQYQIIVDLNAKDLTGQQPLDLTGRIKLVPLKDRKDEIVDSKECQTFIDATHLNFNHDKINFISEKHSSISLETVDRNKCNANRLDRNIGPAIESWRYWTSPMKRTVSEETCISENDSEHNKRLKLGRSCSFQEVDLPQKPNNYTGTHPGLLNTEDKFIDQEKHNYHEQNTSSGTKTIEAKNDIAMNKMVALNVPETKIQSQMYTPPWIPPQMFQQFAYHPLSTYADPRWLHLCRQNSELTSMENVFRQPFDTSLLRRVYASLDTSKQTNSIPTSARHDGFTESTTSHNRHEQSVTSHGGPVQSVTHGDGHVQCITPDDGDAESVTPHDGHALSNLQNQEHAQSNEHNEHTESVPSKHAQLNEHNEHAQSVPS